MTTIDPALVLAFGALLAVVACVGLAVAALAVVCVAALRGMERQAEATAARLQARSLTEHEDVLHPPVTEPRGLIYEEGPDAEVFRQAGIGDGDPNAAQKARKWNEHFRNLDQQFTHNFGPGGRSPIIPPPPSRIGAE